MKAPSTPATDAPPPAAPDAEKALACILLTHPDKALAAITEADLTQADFYVPTYRILLRHAQKMQEEGSLNADGSMDSALLLESLRQSNELEAVGGAAGISSIYGGHESLLNAGEYCKLIKEASRRRELIQAAKEAEQKAYDYNTPCEEILDGLQQSIDDDRAKTERKQPQDMKSLWDEVVTRVEARLKGKTPPYLTTGFPNLDAITEGIQPRRYYILGARPAQGKTALALNVARAAAHDDKIPGKVLFYSLEMSPADLCERLWSALAGVNVRKCTLSETIRKKLSQSMRVLNKEPLELIDATGMTAESLLADVRRRHRQAPCKLVIIDYLQILHPASVNAQAGDVEKIALVSSLLRDFAHSENIPVLALAQINRAGGKADKPGMADLKGSGQIEQDADAVMILHRPEAYLTGEEAEKVKDQAYIYVDKNRHGSTGTVRLQFDATTTGFYSIIEN